MLKRVQVGFSLVRHLGPRWACSRTRHAIETRLGQLERRMPCQDWDELPLAGFLANPANASPEAYAEARRARPVCFLFDPADRRRYERILRGFDVGTDGPVPRTEALLLGVLRHFERHDLEVGWPPDWFRNPFTGERLTSACHWSRVPTFAAGDIKCVWEASRFGFAYLLVRAYWRAGDERFAEGFWRAVEDWRLGNPPNSGPNWKCGQEIAFRLMAWLFGAYGVADARATTPARWAMLAQMIAVSTHRIEAHLEYALSQENNHGISEALALWTVGLLLPEFKRAPHWEAMGRRWLEQLAHELIYDDGGFSQHSVNYHRVMLHDYLWAIRLGELNRRPLSDALKSRVARAGDWLVGMMDSGTGQAPNWGSNDGALVLPLNNCGYADFRPAAQAVSVLLAGRRRFEPGPWDEDLFWLLGADALDLPVAEPAVAGLAGTESGCHVLRRRDGFMFIHCPTRFRHRPSQADLLHVDLWWRGRNLAQDAGTYSYNTPEPEASWFPGTASHNTISVDALDQMDRPSHFIWLPWPRGKVRQIPCSGQKAIIWEGSHAGYGRLADPVLHKRAVVGFGDAAWLVLDRVSGRIPHRYRLHWLLGSFDPRWEAIANRLLLMVDGAEYFVRVGCDIPGVTWSAGMTGREWVSRHYLEKEPAWSLTGEVSVPGATFWTLFSPRESLVSLIKDRVDACCGTDVVCLRVQGMGEDWLLESCTVGGSE